MKYLILLTLSFNVMAWTDKEIDGMNWKDQKHSLLMKGVSSYKEYDILGEPTGQFCYKTVDNEKVLQDCPTLAMMKSRMVTWKLKMKEMNARKKYVKKNSKGLLGKLYEGDLTKAEMGIVLLKMYEEIKELKRK